MKNQWLLLLSFVLCSTLSFAQKDRRTAHPSEKKIQKYEKTILSAPRDTFIPPPLEGRDGKGPFKQVEFLEDMHFPHQQITPKLHDQLLREVKMLPSDKDGLSKNSSSEWNVLGPYGMRHKDRNVNFSGRIRDIEVSDAGLRIASASGGLWGWKMVFIIPVPVPLSESVSTQWTGAFATHPNNKNNILLGTGEPFIRGGTGLWRTNNGGATWTNVNTMSPRPSSFFKILYDPNNANVIHVAAGEGYYRSTDGGRTWRRHLSGVVSDVVVNPRNSNILFAGRWGDRIYKSTNGGITWTALSSNGAPTSNVGRINLAIAPTAPNRVYASITRNDNARTHGIYRTLNHGATWSRCNIGNNINGDNVDEFHWGQGWYNNCIAISPINSRLIYVGGGALFRSTDGVNFNEIPAEHADQHTLEFSKDGRTLYLGNDGGVFFSSDNGDSWNSGLNLLPITQFGHFANSIQDARVMIGGTQDNGNPYTRGTSTQWNTISGDGGGAAVDPFNTDRRYAKLGVYGGDLAFRQFRITNNGGTWTDINNGVADCRDWYTKIRTDYLFPAYLYSNCGNQVYISRNQGSNWSALNTPFSKKVTNISVSRGTPLVYACLEGGTTDKIKVYESGVWYNRSLGLPTDTDVRKVVPDLRNRNIAYAIMRGTPASGSTRKVFKTINRGISWTNVTGNLPNVPLNDLIPHPSNSNRLYACGEFGCFKTTNAGATWQRWDAGMPEYIMVTEMAYEDSRSVDGKFYVYAATYGRGIWKRDVLSDDSATNDVLENRVAEIKPFQFELHQNFPNPAQDATEIVYEISAPATVQLKLYNSVGQLVKELDSGQKNAGMHRVRLNVNDLSSGLYLYDLIVNEERQQKKMLVQQ